MNVRKLIAGIVLAPLILVGGGIGGCEARKAYYDWQVRKMCEKDGGVAVYERITIGAEQAARLSAGGVSLSLPTKGDRNPGQEYYRQELEQQIRASNPEIVRSETVLLRAADNKMLGRRVAYWRRGGDFPSPAHESYFVCPSGDASLVSKVFTVNGGTK